jgi:hypothetical protein
MSEVKDNFIFARMSVCLVDSQLQRAFSIVTCVGNNISIRLEHGCKTDEQRKNESRALHSDIMEIFPHVHGPKMILFFKSATFEILALRPSSLQILKKIALNLMFIVNAQNNVK